MVYLNNKRRFEVRDRPDSVPPCHTRARTPAWVCRVPHHNDDLPEID